jgi:hypothetical protein
LPILLPGVLADGDEHEADEAESDKEDEGDDDLVDNELQEEDAYAFHGPWEHNKHQYRGGLQHFLS